MSARRENLNSIYILLFLEIAFFLIQFQDPERYGSFFAFDRGRVMRGEIWRLFTFQFVHGGLLSLFFGLLILYVMGSVVEEACGTFDFIAFLLLSMAGAVGVGFLFDVPLLASSFSTFSLLFIFATMVPDQVFYIFFVLPVKVRWLAWIALAYLGFGLISQDAVAIAALAGSILSYGYYLLRHGKIRVAIPSSVRKQGFKAAESSDQRLAEHNLERFSRMKASLDSRSAAQVEELIASIEPTIVPGVNICPPADYKPEGEDRYCVRCEGFSECSVRYLNARMPEAGESESASSE